ncbi:MAG: hypothetical protein ACJ8CR_07410, partial [Roseiflexaceae bacterium]
MPSAAMDTPPAGLGLPVLRGASATPSSTPPTHRPAGITHTDDRRPTTDGRRPTADSRCTALRRADHRVRL